MLSTNYGGLVPEDELLTHQIVDTFATVSQSDPSWTEKIWTIAHARDNSLQVVLGIGKYTNRGVFDGAAGVCRGTEQWTVRAGRRLSSDPAGTHVGPIHYGVVEPLRAIRVSLDATEHAPIAFDVELRGAFDAALEDPWPDRSTDGYRVTHNVLRYHQIGVASGWVEVAGDRTEISADEWISIRDHSWGLRPGVGKPIPGLPRGGRKIKQMFMTWLPMTMTRPDGSAYSLFVMYQEERGDGFLEIRCQAEQQNDDGSSHRFASVEQDLQFQDDNRRFTHGTITLIDSDGTKRPLTITAAGPTGFHLGTAGYYGWNDWVYGQWVGDLKVEGNHVTDCDKPENARIASAAGSACARRGSRRRGSRPRQCRDVRARCVPRARPDGGELLSVTKPRVAIIGAGPGGIAMALQLARGGYDFTIFDRADGFGGTWRNNTYPGAACDVPSHFYSYSFALNPRWSKTFAGQPEILAYLEKVAHDHHLADHLVACTRVTTLRWSDTDGRWTLETEDGGRREFDAVVTAVGMLDVPNVPDIPGAERFPGRAFHSSNWDHSKSTAGERVASIGTGASAIQYVPAIAAEAAHLTVFQRTPIWVSPRYDEPFTPEQQDLFERDRDEALKVRDAAFQQYEAANFAVDSTMTKELTEMAWAYLQRKVTDPALRAKLTPSYPVGCKRPLQSRDWFPALCLPHVHLETSAIAEFTERGLYTADGVEHEVDTVIYGTGFHAADYLRSLDVHGAGGRRLRDDWHDGAEAYVGTVVPGYPNLFTLYGPNTNGVTSIIYILEAQAEFVRRTLDDMVARRVQAIDIKRDIHDAYNDEIQQAMQSTVWLANCNNYYRHPNGKVVTQFPHSGTKFVAMLAEVGLDAFDRMEATACPESTTLR